MRRTVWLLLSLCLVTFSANADTVCQQRHCLAVVDAGSTGSRLHIYAYDLDNYNQPTQVSELWSKKIKPGFSTIDLNQETVSTYLNNLFTGAPETNMPVYFYATAGMRLLPQPKQEQYYQTLQQWFNAQSQWQLVDAKTITGSEEGIYGWLAVNYQLGTLTSRDKPLVGVMDMGGASVQVTFPVENTSSIRNSDIVSLDVSGRHLTLFVHSFLGLGQTVLSQQFLDSARCFSKGYQLPSGMQGEGDAASCEFNVATLITKVHKVNHIVPQAIASNPVSAWYTIGGAASLAEDKPFTFTNRQFTNRDLLQQANSSVCHAQWSDLYAQYPKNDYLYGYCLFPAYYYALMVEGYGIKPQQPVNLMPAGQGSDWTLGVVLHQS